MGDYLGGISKVKVWYIALQIMGLFLISIVYQTIANRRLDLVRLCPDRLKAIVYYIVGQPDRLLLIGDPDLGRAAPNPIVY